MRISVVADVHGNFDALARVAEHAEQLVVLGDLLDYVDYHDPAGGIIGGIFGADAGRHFTELRAAGDFTELRRYNGSLWARLADPVGVLSEAVDRRYRTVLEAIGPNALLTLGNVDVAAEWNRVAAGVLPYRDAEVVTVGGARLGFVAGGATRRRPPDGPDIRAWRPFLRPWDEYLSAVRALGPVDVLCSHIPPEIPLARYDVVPGRLEMAGPGLTEYIDTYRPALALYGHVHQPIAPRVRRGVTECVNVGHFQRRERALHVDLDSLPHDRVDGHAGAAFAHRDAGR